MVSQTPFNAKHFGGTVEMIFRAEAAKRGYHPFNAPNGDHLALDAIVYNAENCKTYRVQIKSTSVADKSAASKHYRIAVKKGAGGELKPEHFDVLACYIQPHDAWYLLPNDPKIIGGASLKFFTHVRNSRSKMQPYLNNWEIFNT
jgi:hypothetical protein